MKDKHNLDLISLSLFMFFNGIAKRRHWFWEKSTEILSFLKRERTFSNIRSMVSLRSDLNVTRRFWKFLWPFVTFLRSEKLSKGEWYETFILDMINGPKRLQNHVHFNASKNKRTTVPLYAVYDGFF